MRHQPIGTGPFKFVEFKPNESIKVAKNPDYWKPGLPYLDGIEYTVIAQHFDCDAGASSPASSTAFAPGILSLPLMKEIKSQAPERSASRCRGTSRRT